MEHRVIILPTICAVMEMSYLDLQEHLAVGPLTLIHPTLHVVDTVFRQ